ncbi:MAG: hypothetical protein ACI3XR_02885 [Eubacteriales bacterium]
MRKETIAGIGSVHAGEYSSICIEGMGKLKGKIKAEKINIEGMGKSKGTLEADELCIEGTYKSKKPIKIGKMSVEGAARLMNHARCDEVRIDGMLKIRRGNLVTCKLICDGMLVSTKEVGGDQVDISGICSVDSLVGDEIRILWDESGNQNIRINGNIGKFLRLGRLYFGRKLSESHNLADRVECTHLVAARLHSREIRAGSVELTDRCVVERLICDGEIRMSRDCEIGKIVSEGEPNIIWIDETPDREYSEEEIRMATKEFVEILEAYKVGAIDADEAERRTDEIKGHFGRTLPWENDGKVRIVAFIGQKLLKKGDSDCRNLEATLDGEIRDVDCWGNLSCGDVRGNVKAGSHVTCGDVGGSVAAGSTVNCSDVGNGVSAGSSVKCGDVNGNINAGSSVDCGDVSGAIRAGGGVHMK